MSALGQKRTCAVQKSMSALPPKADMCVATRDVRFGPKADIAQPSVSGVPGRLSHHFERVATGQIFDIAQLTSNPIKQPKITSATLCKPFSTSVSLEWCVTTA